MKIVSLTKTWRGSEWAIAALKSNYAHIDKAIFVHSEVSWTGEAGNDVRAETERWCKDHDKENKVININFDSESQADQYNHAIEYAEKNLEFDWFMVSDTDEVWDDDNWGRALRYLNGASPDTNGFTVRMFTFIKSPFFRIEPMDSCQPVTFIRKGVKYNGNRFSDTNPRKAMEDVFFHHFSGVRKRLDLVIQKHTVSSKVENTALHNMDEWVLTKWNYLPYATRIHPNSEFSGTWERVVVVPLESLPKAAQQAPITQAFLNYPMAAGVAADPSNEILQGLLDEAHLPHGFGPGHQDWNVPSRRQRYEGIMDNLRKKMIEAVTSKTGQKIPTESVAIRESKPKEVKIHDLTELEFSKLPPSKQQQHYLKMHDTGKLCITTMVSGPYQWYIPLFLDRCRKELPEYDVSIVFRGKIDDSLRLPEVTVVEDDDFPLAPFNTAALRFATDFHLKDSYDFVLITDIDMMMYREERTIIDQHMLDLRLHHLECYSNYVSSHTETPWGVMPRLPGVHFVTRDWWERTKAAREFYRGKLKEEIKEYWYDEVMLADIALRSDLFLNDKDVNLWCHHGIHLGDYRNCVFSNQMHYRPPAHDLTAISKMVEDSEFMAKVEASSKYLPMIGQIFKMIKGYV